MVSTIQQEQRQTTRESATILAVGVAATAHVRVIAETGAEVEPLPESCTVVNAVDRGGGVAKDIAWGISFMDDAVSVEAQ